MYSLMERSTSPIIAEYDIAHKVENMLNSKKAPEKVFNNNPPKREMH